MTRRRRDAVLSAGKFPPASEIFDRFDLFRARLLLCEHMIQTENHHRVGVVKDRLVYRQALTRLVNPLIDDDRLSCDLTDKVLKPHGRQMK